MYNSVDTTNQSSSIIIFLFVFFVVTVVLYFSRDWYQNNLSKNNIQYYTVVTSETKMLSANTLTFDDKSITLCYDNGQTITVPTATVDTSTRTFELPAGEKIITYQLKTTTDATTGQTVVILIDDFGFSQTLLPSKQATSIQATGSPSFIGFVLEKIQDQLTEWFTPKTN